MLARLKPIIDQFFDEVMVMAEDQQVRHNRFSLLKQLRELFFAVWRFIRITVAT